MYACEIEPAAFYSESFPVARKQFWCCECRAPILVGEKHLAASGKNEDFWYVRQHMACREVCMEIAASDDCLCFGDMKQWWYDGGNDLPRGHKLRSLMAVVVRRERTAARAPRGEP